MRNNVSDITSLSLDWQDVSINVPWRLPQEEYAEQPYDGLSFQSPEVLDAMRNAKIAACQPGDYDSHKDYEHLRKVHIDLNHAHLTDKQMIAVSLVFYGKVSRKRAAHAMRISTQCLKGHLDVALEKIERSLL